MDCIIWASLLSVFLLGLADSGHWGDSGRDRLRYPYLHPAFHGSPGSDCIPLDYCPPSSNDSSNMGSSLPFWNLGCWKLPAVVGAWELHSALSLSISLLNYFQLNPFECQWFLAETDTYLKSSSALLSRWSPHGIVVVMVYHSSYRCSNVFLYPCTFYPCSLTNIKIQYL